MKARAWISALAALTMAAGMGGCGAKEKKMFDFDADSIRTESDYERLIDRLSGAPAKADVEDEYEIHADGGMIYDPISRDVAAAKGARTAGSVSLDGMTLEYSLPTEADPYTVVPVDYTLRVPADHDFPVHVEATAFEESARKKGGDVYDMTVPGTLDVRFEYLGYVAGFERGGARHIMAADYRDVPAARYPSYDTTELRNSGVAEAADYHWFKFRYTNVGDTILDGEGAGAMIFAPVLSKKIDGSFQKIGVPYNKYYRMEEYLYPGESKEMWIAFGPNVDTPNMAWGLSEGEYEINLEALWRNHSNSPDQYARTQFSGMRMCNSTFAFSVEDAPRDVAPTQPVSRSKTAGAHNIWLHHYEEFMTGYETWAARKPEMKGTVYVQVAPWTEEITLKLISTAPLGIATAAIPVRIRNENAKVDLNEFSDRFVVREDGTRYPMIFSQSQADMRANIQQSPYPEEQIVKDLLAMKACGINAISTTMMPWLYDINNAYGTLSGGRVNPQGDAYKFTLDAARKVGIKVEGIGNYPFGRTTVGNVARWADKVNYTISPALSYWGCEADPGDPNLPAANASQARYQFNRWGDNYYTLADGTIPIGFEDTRGWMRIDIQTRYPIGDEGKKNFRAWALDRYKTIGAANKAWQSDFARIRDVDPEAGLSANRNGYYFAYGNATGAFRDWTAATADLDIYRTEQRNQNYRDFLAAFSDVTDKAKIAMRTEGGNWLAAGIPDDVSNSHYRHIHYSQRRNGMIAELIQVGGYVTSHSDYVTLPYTASEVRELTRASVAQGITPMPLVQFNNMRDIAINRIYGTDYTTDYHLASRRLGAFVHTLTASFPWYKALYEEGGVPGILWQDFECDGHVTETQIKELKFFKQKLDEALATPAGIAWKTNFTAAPSDVGKSRGMYSYDQAYVQSVVDLVKSGSVRDKL